MLHGNNLHHYRRLFYHRLTSLRTSQSCQNDGFLNTINMETTWNNNNNFISFLIILFFFHPFSLNHLMFLYSSTSHFLSYPLFILAFFGLPLLPLLLYFLSFSSPYSFPLIVFRFYSSLSLLFLPFASASFTFILLPPSFQFPASFLYFRHFLLLLFYSLSFLSPFLLSLPLPPSLPRFLFLPLLLQHPDTHSNALQSARAVFLFRRLVAENVSC